MIPLFTTKQVRAADEYAIRKLQIPGTVLMENAAVNISDTILDNIEELNPFDKIGIVTGKGNNGGDGFAVARHLINSDFFVIVVSLAKENELKGESLANFKILKNLIGQTGSGKIISFRKNSDLNILNECALIVDAMLGTGTKGNIREPYVSVIKKLNELNSNKVSIDIPSGLDADSGYGEVVFEADTTVTLAEMKRGLFIGTGNLCAGEVIKGGIGIGSEFFDNLEVDDYCIEPEDAFEGLPVKYLNDHKYSAGKVLTVAGSGKLPGAAFFTANSTQKVGCGASLLAFPESIKETAFVKLDGSTVLAYDDAGKEYLSLTNVGEIQKKIVWADVVAIGPGLGRQDETVEAVIALLKKNKNKKFVIDADAIYTLKDDKYKDVNLKNSVLTPHFHEFSELIGISVDELQKDILKYGKTFATETGSMLVLKGAPTIIFTPDGEALINTTGNPGMAKFGTGDVLTGVIAGLIAQNKQIEKSVITAVYLHSLAADILHEEKTVYGFTATDIMNYLPKAVKLIVESVIQDY